MEQYQWISTDYSLQFGKKEIRIKHLSTYISD